MSGLSGIVFSADFIYSILRVTTPILLAALGSVLASNVGIANLTLEGTMTIAALTGVIFSALTQNAWLGLLAAILFGCIFTGIFSLFVLRYKANDVVAGITMNLMASGLAPFLLYQVTGEKGVSSKLHSLTLPVVELPFICDIPVLGPAFSGHNVMTYLAFLMVAAVSLLLYRTRRGAWMRATGADEDTARSVGIPTNKTKLVALLLSGALASCAGAYMSMGYLNMFTSGIIAGRGYIAIAAEAMGGGAPLGTMLGAVIFGVFDAIANAAQSLSMPAELIQCIPYAATILGLIAYTLLGRMKSKNKLARSGKF